MQARDIYNAYPCTALQEMNVTDLAKTMNLQEKKV